MGTAGSYRPHKRFPNKMIMRIRKEIMVNFAFAC